MPSKNRTLLLLAASVSVIVGSGCASAGSTVATPPEVVTVRDIDASGDEPTYFSFSEGGVVEGTDDWDLSFAGTSIGVSGEALVLDRAFQRIVEAPETGYRRDEPDKPAISTDPELRWFDYNTETHVVSPVPFRTIVVRTASGDYAKVEITDYYDALGTPRFYTIRYAFQPGGSRLLETSEG